MTHTIHITAEQFFSENLKDLQLYDYEGLIFFRACNQLWEYLEDTGRFRMVYPFKTSHTGYSVGVTL
jgi:hypothetical protein